MNSLFRRTLRFAPIAVAGVVIGVVSCTQQGDGQRCSHLNGNLDCADGLVCVSSKQLGGNADICCLATGDSNPECIPGGGTSTGTSTTGAGGANGSTTSTATTTTSTASSTSTATTTTTSASSTTASSTSGTTTSAATTTSTAAGG